MAISEGESLLPRAFYWILVDKEANIDPYKVLFWLGF